jgi:gamma-glutamyl phosphate reductase
VRQRQQRQETVNSTNKILVELQMKKNPLSKLLKPLATVGLRLQLILF